MRSSRWLDNKDTISLRTFAGPKYPVFALAVAVLSVTDVVTGNKYEEVRPAQTRPDQAGTDRGELPSVVVLFYYQYLYI